MSNSAARQWSAFAAYAVVLITGGRQGDLRPAQNLSDWYHRLRPDIGDPRDGEGTCGVLISADFSDLGCRIIFLINLPVVVAVLIFGLPLLPEVRGDSPAPIDRIGVLLCALTLGLLIVPPVEGRELGWPSWTIAMLLACPVHARAIFSRAAIAFQLRD